MDAVLVAGAAKNAVANALYPKRCAGFLVPVNTRTKIRKVPQSHYASVFVADWAPAQTFRNWQKSGVFSRDILEFL
jgi:hypothetical protein